MENAESPNSKFVQELEQKFVNTKTGIVIDCDTIQKEFDELRRECDRFSRNSLDYIRMYRNKLHRLVSECNKSTVEILNQVELQSFIESKISYLNGIVIEGTEIKIFDSPEDKKQYLDKLKETHKI